ncbi:hypothetical protein pEaSNUABM11_00116 [Erwinia phage pEa_SNUABM_11]|nr:hypothetical protein pEaSNUABM11_00116 [Erwinia phage pEa_SNUABM_11]
MSLEQDFEILCDDFDRLVALESLGVRPDNAAVRAIAKRWHLEQRGFVAGESRDKKPAKTSNLLAQVFNDWAGYFGTRYVEWTKKQDGQAAALEKHAEQLDAKLGQVETLNSHTVPSGSWTSKVCFEDLPNFKECIKLSNAADGMDAVVKQYTVITRQIVLSPVIDRRKLEDGELTKIGYSSNAAIHRASGILGKFGEDDVQARPLAGNVIVVTRNQGDKGKVQYAIAHGGDFKKVIPSLEKSECVSAVKAIRKIAASLRKRGAKNGLFGYKGIYEEVEKMKAELLKLEGADLKKATLRYKNALELENAFTHALDRVGDGLVNWVTASIKAG